MIPTIETIIEKVAAGAISKQQAIDWINQHLELSQSDGLRDAFAMAAMPALIPMDLNSTGVAKSAYKHADEMMKARRA